ncbi:MAG TPA: cation-transporting P-type ATPase [Candidatus Paceibacterota bacterium]
MVLEKNHIEQKAFWALSLDESFDLLKSSNKGIDMDDVPGRIKNFGRNVIPRGKRLTRLDIFLNQFKSPLIIILLIAGIITVFLDHFVDSLFIFGIIIVNTLMGFYQENKSETALSQLTTYIKERTRVIRGGVEKEVDAEEIVPGDLVRLISGSRIPADLRLVKVKDLSIDESILTGESLPITNKIIDKVEYSSPVFERSSMAFAGTLVNGGLGQGLVVATGPNTELGKIAAMVEKGEKIKTPLQIAIGRFTLRLSLIIIFLTITLFSIGLMTGKDLFDIFFLSVAVAVSAIPEGLPVALTVILAIGVERLAKKRGIVRQLLAAETLGGTTVILTDKTGTLTQAKMKLSQIISTFPKEEVLEAALINTDIIIDNPDSPPGEWRLIGRPLEAALVAAAAEHNVFMSEYQNEIEILDQQPFNSNSKFSVFKVKKGKKTFSNYLGAPDILIDKSNLNHQEKNNLLLTIDDLAFSGYRVLGVMRDRDFLGLLAFNDPVRPTVKESIEKTIKAGVSTIILTGDHRGTAISVAKEVGLDVKDEDVVTGEDLKVMDDTTLKARLGNIKIFARVAPEDKLRIARLYKERGDVVAMTGDGVNDSPALKEADIGIAVGSGTDVAKGAADLVILDDNFDTIVAAIEEGRRTLSNIKKVIVYLLSNLLDEIILIGGAIIAGVALPLSALQILWVNFFLDSFPAVSLAFENGKDHLKEKPTSLRGRLLDPEMRFLIIVVGIFTSVILFLMYLILLRIGLQEDLVRTFIFASFSLYSLFLIFSVRDLKTSIFEYNPFSNLYLTGAVMIGFILTASAIYIPFLQNILDTAPLNWFWVSGVFTFGILNILAVEFGKWLYRKSE